MGSQCHDGTMPWWQAASAKASGWNDSVSHVLFADRIVEYKPGTPALELPAAEMRNLPQIAKVS